MMAPLDSDICTALFYSALVLAVIRCTFTAARLAGTLRRLVVIVLMLMLANVALDQPWLLAVAGAVLVSWPGKPAA
jgi:hypothetical protein